MKEDILKDLATEFFGEASVVMHRLAGSGSNRVYYRIFDNEGKRSVVGVCGTDVCENRSFIYLANYFKSQGLSVPEVYSVSDDEMCYLQEDLGDVDLFSLLSSRVGAGLVRDCIEGLPLMQFCGGVDYSCCYPVSEFGRRQVMWDLNYFKYCFLKLSGVSFDESGLEDDYVRFCDVLLSAPREMWGFQYRDCQSRNVMIKDGKPYWIDFQSGRYGPCLYDLVSFLWQAKARFGNEFREEMIDCYLSSCRSNGFVFEESKFRELLPQFVLFRTLQVLGAYGFRGLIEHKSHFIESIPFAVENLCVLLSQGVANSYPSLKNALEALVKSERFQCNKSEKMTISVFSFSYKRGYPEDMTGNGGGFMFDCRAMHNPGRYDEYKRLTGLDEPVVVFLEERGEVQRFLRNVWELTDSAVERYLARGFTDLQIGFGCTGGQHRSVYCAESTACHIVEKFAGVRVRLNHREQNIVKVLEKGDDL